MRVRPCRLDSCIGGESLAVEIAEGFESGVGMGMVEPPVLLICSDRRPQGRFVLAGHLL
jgi:hypothetical protein